MSFLKKLFGLEKPEPQSEEAVGYVMTVHGNVELAVAESLLRDAEMPYRLVDRDAGGVTRMVAGYTMYGTDILVRPEDVKTARELLAPATDAQNEAEESDGADA